MKTFVVDVRILKSCFDSLRHVRVRIKCLSAIIMAVFAFLLIKRCQNKMFVGLFLRRNILCTKTAMLGLRCFSSEVACEEKVFVENKKYHVMWFTEISVTWL